MIVFYKAVDLPGKIKKLSYDYSVLDSSIKICFLLFIELILYLAFFVNWQLQHLEQEFERELFMGCIYLTKNLRKDPQWGSSRETILQKSWNVAAVAHGHPHSIFLYLIKIYQKCVLPIIYSNKKLDLDNWLWFILLNNLKKLKSWVWQTCS